MNNKIDHDRLPNVVYSKHKGTELNGRMGLFFSSIKAVAMALLAFSYSFKASNTLPRLYLKWQMIYQKLRN